MKDLVIYHANCPDGLGAALAAYQGAPPGRKFLAANYQEPEPDVSGYSRVFVVDFSYPAEVLDRWEAAGKSAIVLDHHATASHVANRPDCVWDVAKSGAVLAWEFFHPEAEVPLLFLYLQDRDLWRWVLPGSREVSAGLAARERTIEALQRILEETETDNCEKLLREGTAILAYQARVIATHVERAKLDGEKFNFKGVPVVNATSLISEIGNELLKAHPEAPFAALWQEIDGKRIWSLRSEDGRADVSLIAKARNGGGHRNAAGFSEMLSS